MRVQQEVGRHHDGGEHVVEVVGDAAGQLADRFHLLGLVALVLGDALAGGVEHVDDRGLGLAVVLLDRRDVEAAPALVGAAEGCLDRRNLALASGRALDRGIQRLAVAFGDDGQDRAALGVLEGCREQAGKQRIGARDLSGLVDRGDRHRRRLEEAHEAHFGRARRIGGAALRAVENQRARRARRAVGAERDLVEQAHGQRAARAGLEVEVHHLGLHLAGSGAERGEKGRPAARDDVGQHQPAGADLGEIMIEPGGERGVDVADVALAIDREEAGRRVVEVVDGVLQLLEDVFLPLAVTGDVDDAPERELAHALAVAERPDAKPEPVHRLAAQAGDADLLLRPAAFAGGLEQAVDRLRDVRIADEHPLDRPHVVGVAGIDQVEIGGVGVDHPAALIGDQQPVDRLVDHRLEHRMGAVLAADVQDPGRQRKQREHACHRQKRKQRQDIRSWHCPGRSAKARPPRRPAPPPPAAPCRCCRRVPRNGCDHTREAGRFRSRPGLPCWLDARSGKFDATQRSIHFVPDCRPIRQEVSRRLPAVILRCHSGAAREASEPGIQ